MNECMIHVYRLLCSCCLRGGPDIQVNPRPGRRSLSCVVKKEVCDPELILSPDRSCLCKVRVACVRKSTYKGEVKTTVMSELMNFFVFLFTVKSFLYVQFVYIILF